MHGDEGRAEDQQQDSDKLYVGRIPGESKDEERIFESSEQLNPFFTSTFTVLQIFMYNHCF